MKRIVYVSILVCLSVHAQEWTWLFKKDFSEWHCRSNAKKREIVFSKIGVPQFTQMMCSWNAFRPEQGHFSFYAQVRDAQTKKWHDWHQVADWGNGVQRSYCSTLAGSAFKFVRLELPDKAYADGLRIKVIPRDGARLSNVKSIAANVANLTSFSMDSISKVAGLPSVNVKGIVPQSQMVLNHEKSGSMCSPTSSYMLSHYLTGFKADPVEFAEFSFDHGLEAFGSWPFNTAHAFDYCKGSHYFRVARLNSFEELHQHLAKNIPVVVSVRGQLEGAPKTYNKGHLLLVAGWDQAHKKVLCYDPAFAANEQVPTAYNFSSFAQAWGRSRHLAYVAMPK